MCIMNKRETNKNLLSRQLLPLFSVSIMKCPTWYEPMRKINLTFMPFLSVYWCPLISLFSSKFRIVINIVFSIRFTKDARTFQLSWRTKSSFILWVYEVVWLCFYSKVAMNLHQVHPYRIEYPHILTTHSKKIPTLIIKQEYLNIFGRPILPQRYKIRIAYNK